MKDAIEKIEVRPGIFAAIYYDDSPENPWKAWYGQPPLLAYSDRSLTPYGEEVTAGDLLRLIPEYRFRSRAFQDAILDALNLERETILWDRKNYPGTTFRDAVLDRAGEGLSKEYRTDYLDGLETLAGFAKVPTYRGTATGSCQSHWAELLLFATPDWQKETGIAAGNIPASLEADAELWEAWAFGDVYGYVLETGDTEDEDGDTVEGEELDSLDPGGHYSCWGYYGSDHKESGLIEAATESADAFISHMEKKAKADAAWQEREASESFDAACRDIVTV